MKILVQRVKEAKVIVQEKCISQIGKGYLLFVCVEKDDDIQCVTKAAQKIANLRIFEDENGKMNNSIIDTNGEILSVSQFTLSWDGQKGNRPSFDRSKNPEESLVLFNEFNQILEGLITGNLKMGAFGEHMEVSLINDGPATFNLEFS